MGMRKQQKQRHKEKAAMPSLLSAFGKECCGFLWSLDSKVMLFFLPYLLLLYLHLLCHSILGRWLTSTTLRDIKIHIGLQWFNSESHSLSLSGLWIVSGFITPETHVLFSAEVDENHSVTGFLWGIWGCPAASAGQLLCSSFHARPKFMESEGWHVRISFSVLVLNSSQDMKQNVALKDALSNDWSDFANFPNTCPPSLFESSSS